MVAPPFFFLLSAKEKCPKKQNLSFLFYLLGLARNEENPLFPGVSNGKLHQLFSPVFASFFERTQTKRKKTRLPEKGERKTPQRWPFFPCPTLFSSLCLQISLQKPTSCMSASRLFIVEGLMLDGKPKLCSFPWPSYRHSS